MKCIRVHRARRSVHRTAAAFAICVGARSAGAQQPYPTYPTYPPAPTYPAAPQYPQYPQPATGVPAQPVVLPAYRIPVITIAQPADGIALPDDKPVIVLRFASAEALDPVDALSFALTVDGADRTTLFQLTQGEAWGPLSTAGELLATGQHDVRARICTAHGVCGSAKATVNIVPASSVTQLVAGTSSDKSKQQRRGRVFDAVLQAVRVLIR